MKPEKYDRIGIGYNQTRKADPYVADRLFQHLQSKADGLYLDIGCGTGNYTLALYQKGLNFIGIDPSQKMLSIARDKNKHIDWRHGRAENTYLTPSSIDGITASLTIHHWSDLVQAFGEMARILKQAGRMVIFTSTPRQMKGYWLNHYFPRMLEASIQQMPAYRLVEAALLRAGLSAIHTEIYEVRPDLQDLFLYSGKQQPALYLNPIVRKGISSFADLAHAEEVKAGLEELNMDIQNEKIWEVIRRYQHGHGDYLFIVAKKQ